MQKMSGTMASGNLPSTSWKFINLSYILLIKKIVPQISTSNYWDSEQDDGEAVINSIYPAQILDELRNGHFINNVGRRNWLRCVGTMNFLVLNLRSRHITTLEIC